MRTHTCNDLILKDVNKKVILCGWVNGVREHGGISFINLRDRYGITQVVFKEKVELKEESVVQIKGKVVKRPKGIVNKKIPTGEIEVVCEELNVLNESDNLPIDMSGQVESTEDTRLKYRYLDLRKDLSNVQARHKANMAVHEFLDKQGFLHVETPLLIRSTPEGARDFIVPSRIHKGNVYSLPQSPQLYKQISMVAGVDKYYQVAKCLRDEDLRQDRQPEFTQIDIEMSFVEQDDIIKLSEGLIKHVFEKVNGVKLKTPFRKMTYCDAMSNYGIDRPDLRFDMKLTDVTETVKGSGFKVFEAECVKALVAPREFSRKECDKLTDFVKLYEAKGLVYLRMDKTLEGPVAKFLSDDVKKVLIKQTKIKKGETLFIIADNNNICNDALAHLRLQLGKELELIDETKLEFVWITEFPLFEKDEDRWKPMHHIFSMPISMDFSNPGLVTGYLHDLVLNGTELGGGSIRIHKKDIQEKVLEVIGMNYKQAENAFGFLLNSFRFGAPPHGGIAFGFDRIVAMLCNTTDIREVIAFPKNKQMQSPMDQCPSLPDKDFLKELGIKIN